MSSKQPPDFERPSSWEWTKFPNHEVSWVGECPWTRGLCYGTEEGKLLISTEEDFGKIATLDLVKSGEVINGVAFAHENLLAASTRDEVVFYRHPTESEPLNLIPVGPTFDGGAHGIVATSAGCFVAPFDYNGLLLMDVRSDQTYTQRIMKPSGGEHNFYKLARLGMSERGDVFACALRKGGLLGMMLPHHRGPEQPVAHLFQGLDVIDVCSLKDPSHPFASACLGIDRTIVLTRNILEDVTSLALNFDVLEGTAYTVLTAKGHLFILTSESLVTLPNLVSRFLAGDSLNGPMSFLVSVVRAVDAYLAYDRWILLELPEGVARLEVDQLVLSNDNTQTVNPKKIFEDIESRPPDRTPISLPAVMQTDNPMISNKLGPPCPLDFSLTAVP
jgi:hypothetical protein